MTRHFRLFTHPYEVRPHLLRVLRLFFHVGPLRHTAATTLATELTTESNNRFIDSKGLTTDQVQLLASLVSQY